MDSVDIIYKKMNDDTETLALDYGESQIQQFFVGKTIFITGATGFMGKSLMEKLLRTCTDVKKIYLLLRQKDSVSLDEKLNKYFEHTIFDTVRKMNPNYRSKVVPIKGDLQVEKLGLSEEDRKIVCEETNIIYHNGAEVKFNAKMPHALKVNVLGTKEMLELAMECKQLLTFIYVSTAYSHSYRLDIDEVFYPAPADLKMVQDIITADAENEAGLNEDVLPTILGEWPNVYTFTKAVAEDLIRQYGKKAPFICVVYRPSVVFSTYKEPICGWCGNINGPAAAFAAAGLGLFRMSYTRDENFDLVPADMCTNSMLAVTWDVVENRKNEKEALIFNFASSLTNPIFPRQLLDYARPFARAEPTIKSIWYPQMNITRCYFVFLIGHVLLHFLPCVIWDICRVLQGKYPDKVLTFFKVQKYVGTLVKFSTTGWRISAKEMTKVWDKMSVADKKLFFCDLRDLDWEEFATTYWRGLRIFVVNDPMDTLEEARKRDNKLRLMHYTLLVVLTLIFFYLTSDFFISIYNMLMK